MFYSVVAQGYHTTGFPLYLVLKVVCAELASLRSREKEIDN